MTTTARQAACSLSSAAVASTCPASAVPIPRPVWRWSTASSTEEQRWEGIGCSFGERVGRGGAVDASHCDARVRNDDVVGVRDDPGGCGVATAVLAGVAAQPLVEHGLTAVELLTVVPANVEQCGATELSQAN